MEEPNDIDNFEPDLTSEETVSPTKKIILGVVDTSGMKCVSANRKRRWDQAPNESDVDSPIPNKVFISEEDPSQNQTNSNSSESDHFENALEDFPVKEVKTEKSVKFIQGTVEKSFISESLKRIQFSYDEGDSNSSDNSDQGNLNTKTEIASNISENNIQIDKVVNTKIDENGLQDISKEENYSIETGNIDPDVLKTILGSNEKQVIVGSGHLTEEISKSEEKFMIDSAEVIVIDPSKPLTEELSQDKPDKEIDENILIEEMQENIQEIQENIEEMEENIEEMQENIKEAQENIEETQKNIEETQENIEEIQKNIENIQEVITTTEDLMVENNENSNEPEANEEVNSELTEEISILNNEIKEITENESEIVQLPLQVENIEEKTQENQNPIEEKPEINQDLEKELEIHEEVQEEEVQEEVIHEEVQEEVIHEEVQEEEIHEEVQEVIHEEVQEEEIQDSFDKSPLVINEESTLDEIINDPEIKDSQKSSSEENSSDMSETDKEIFNESLTDKEAMDIVDDIKEEEKIPVLKIVTNSEHKVKELRPVPKLAPVTIKIGERGISPLRIECRSPQGQKVKSHNSPHKQLEFTLKIAKDANTNIPKATMSPKSGMTLSPNSVWQLENDKSPESTKKKKIKTEIKTEDEGSDQKENDMSIDELQSQAESNLQDMIKKMLEAKEEVKAELAEMPVKVVRKRGRPRKIQPPVSPTHSFSAPEDPDEESNRPMRSCRGRTKPIVVRTRKPRGGGFGRGGGRGRGMIKPLPSDRESLSAYEKAELAKIEARKEKIRLDQIAKYKAIKEKKLAKKLKDEERRKRIAREKAEKAEAAAPQVFEEETRMSAPESGSRGHTPAPSRLGDHDESQSSSYISTPNAKKGRMQIPIDYELKEVTVDQLAEYQWQGGEQFMVQEQVSLYLGVKSFKRKYPDLKRRPVEAEERTYLEDSGLVPKSMCDLGLTAVKSTEVLDVMFQDFPDKYEEFRKHVREKQAREASSKQKALALARKDGSKVEPREQALEAVANWNANLNRERKEERRCALDLQTFTVHFPKSERKSMTRPVKKVGLYPLAVIPGQFCDYYKKYTPNELMYYPLNTVLYGPLKPNEKQLEDNSESGSDSDDTSSSDDSSDTSSESDSSDDDEDIKCKMCNGTKKNNKNSQNESLIQCKNCDKYMHPTCLELTPEMLPHIEKSSWYCPKCKKCNVCKESSQAEKLMTCDLCNRGYHVHCVRLKKIPEGRWHCTICSYCTSCGTKDPGGTDWQHEFKKSEKGAKIYQRTLCTPCFRLRRRGKYCQVCSKCYGTKPDDDPGWKKCNTCDRFIHKECYDLRYAVQFKNSGFQCDICHFRIQAYLAKAQNKNSV